MAVHPVVADIFQSGPKWWTDQPLLPFTFSMAKNVKESRNIERFFFQINIDFIQTLRGLNLIQFVSKQCLPQLHFWLEEYLFTGSLSLLSTPGGSMVNHGGCADFNSINHFRQIGGSGAGQSFSVQEFKTYDCSCANFPPPPPYPLMIMINYPLIIRTWQ